MKEKKKTKMTKMKELIKSIALTIAGVFIGILIVVTIAKCVDTFKSDSDKSDSDKDNVKVIDCSEPKNAEYCKEKQQEFDEQKKMFEKYFKGGEK